MDLKRLKSMLVMLLLLFTTIFCKPKIYLIKIGSNNLSQMGANYICDHNISQS